MVVALLIEAFTRPKCVSESIYIAEGGSTWEVLGLLLLCVYLQKRESSCTWATHCNQAINFMSSPWNAPIRAFIRAFIRVSEQPIG